MLKAASNSLIREQIEIEAKIKEIVKTKKELEKTAKAGKKETKKEAKVT